VALCERMRVFSVWLQVLVKADAATRARCSGTTQLIRSSLKNTSEERSGREGSEREGAKMNGTCLMIRYAWRVHGGQQHHGGGEFRVHDVVHIMSLLKSESEREERARVIGDVGVHGALREATVLCQEETSECRSHDRASDW
jgi:hypothetical protein